MRTNEERHKERLRKQWRIEATRRREAEINEQIALFTMEMNEKYDVLLEIKIKPMRFKGKSYEHKE